MDIIPPTTHYKIHPKTPHKIHPKTPHKTHPITPHSKPIIKPITKPTSTPETKNSTPPPSNPYAAMPGTRRKINKPKKNVNSPTEKEKERDYYLSKYVPPPSEFDSYDTFESDISTSSSENDNATKSGKISNYCKKYYANHCRPQYSYPLTSINWKRCNMKNWYKPYSKKYLLYKKDCKTSKNKKEYPPNISVGVKVLHKKFPYIWRFLNKKTQKKIIKLAQMPVNMIDIWPNSNNPVYIKKMRTIKKIINKN